MQCAASHIPLQTLVYDPLSFHYVSIRLIKTHLHNDVTFDFWESVPHLIIMHIARFQHIQRNSIF